MCPQPRHTAWTRPYEPDVRGHDCPVDVTRTPPDRWRRIIRRAQVRDQLTKAVEDPLRREACTHVWHLREAMTGLDHGVGHSVLSGLPQSSSRWTQGGWRYLD